MTEAEKPEKTPRWATRKAVAEYTQGAISQAVLERDAWDGRYGIPCYKLDRKVFYDLNEIDAWLTARRRVRTTG